MRLSSHLILHNCCGSHRRNISFWSRKALFSLRLFVLHLLYYFFFFFNWSIDHIHDIRLSIRRFFMLWFPYCSICILHQIFTLHISVWLSRNDWITWRLILKLESRLEIKPFLRFNKSVIVFYYCDNSLLFLDTQFCFVLIFYLLFTIFLNVAVIVWALHTSPWNCIVSMRFLYF